MKKEVDDNLTEYNYDSNNRLILEKNLNGETNYYYEIAPSMLVGVNFGLFSNTEIGFTGSYSYLKDKDANNFSVSMNLFFTLY